MVSALFSGTGAGEPRVDEDVLGGQALEGVLPQETTDQAFGSGGNAVREVEVTPPDFGE